jgi:hypothetical protein
MPKELEGAGKPLYSQLKVQFLFDLMTFGFIPQLDSVEIF